MDKTRLNWGWMQQHMPKVVALLKEKREAGQGAHINECWRRGVLAGEPGWFFAAEGAVSVGVPAEHLLAEPALVQLRKDFPSQALLLLKEVEDVQA